MPRPPYRRIADELREELEGGLYQEGNPIPSTTKLQARFGVSQMTIRSAIGILKKDGYVESVQGKGVYPIPERQRRLRAGPSAEGEVEDVREESDPLEQARKATELLMLYEIRIASLVAVRRRAIARAEVDGLTRTAIAKRLGITKARITQIMEGQPSLSARSQSARRRG